MACIIDPHGQFSDEDGLKYRQSLVIRVRLFTVACPCWFFPVNNKISVINRNAKPVCDFYGICINEQALKDCGCLSVQIKRKSPFCPIKKPPSVVAAILLCCLCRVDAYHMDPFHKISAFGHRDLYSGRICIPQLLSCREWQLQTIRYINFASVPLHICIRPLL